MGKWNIQLAFILNPIGKSKYKASNTVANYCELRGEEEQFMADRLFLDTGKHYHVWLLDIPK